LGSRLWIALLRSANHSFQALRRSAAAVRGALSGARLYVARQKRFQPYEEGDRNHEASASRQIARPEWRSSPGWPGRDRAGRCPRQCADDWAIGGPAQVAVGGNFWTPGATIKIEVINPLVPASGQEQIVNTPETTFLTANSCGQIGNPPNDSCNGPLARVSVPDYVGHALVQVEQCGASCGDAAAQPMGPVVQEVDVLPAAQLLAASEGPARFSPGQPLLCGVSISGSGFGTTPAGQTVQVRLRDTHFNDLAPAQTLTVDSAGNIGIDASGFSFPPTAGVATVTAIPSVVGYSDTASVTLCGGIGTGTGTAGQISAPFSTLGSTTGGSTGLTTGGGAAPSGGAPPPRVHAAE
jgi:hypothetical protein